ncbi:hypothetical protein Tco_1061195 [Tanacetum coccineum]
MGPPLQTWESILFLILNFPFHPINHPLKDHVCKDNVCLNETSGVKLVIVYGADSNGKDPDKECAICLSEPRDTTVLPCRDKEQEEFVVPR